MVKKVVSIGTLGVLSKNFTINTNNTTLDPVSVHKILDKIKRLKIENVILEASSHGLKQHRLNCINFKTAIFTNLSRDHIDYHKTYKDYLNSKLKLFNQLLSSRGNIIFDKKIKYSKILNKISKKNKFKSYTIGGQDSFINVKSIQKVNDQKRLTLFLKKRIILLKLL